MFSFPVMKSSFCFTNINIIADPAASFVNDLRSLRTMIKAVFVRKEGFDAACVLKDDLEVDERIEVGYTKCMLHSIRNVKLVKCDFSQCLLPLFVSCF